MNRQYTAIPFVRGGRDWDGCDCWGLVRLWYEHEYGIVLPSLADDYDSTCSSETAALFETHKSDWQPTNEPEHGDVVLFMEGTRPNHIGVVIDHRYMLHTATARRYSCMERYTAPLWASRIEGFYTYGR